MNELTKKTAKRGFKLGDNGVRIIAFIVILGALALINPTVLSLVNLFGTLNNAAFVGVVSMGLMIVMITGNLDLSLISISLMGGYTSIMVCINMGWDDVSFFVMFAIAAVVGLVCGLVNAFFVYRFNIPGIIVSLGMAQIYNSVLLVATGVTYIPVIPTGMRHFGRTYIFSVETDIGIASINLSVAFFAGAILLVWFVLNKTMVGRGIYALGGDKEAAARAGFNIPFVYSVAYGIMGLLAGIAGMMFYANSLNFQSDPILTEQGNAIAGAIFGGVIMKNGKGTVGGVVVGVLLIGLINNNLYLIGVPSYAQKLVVGVIILVSVALTSINQLREARKNR